MNNQLRLIGVSILLVLATLAGCGGGSTLEAAPPIAAITAQPSDQSVVAGTPATFSVVASNASGYQWQSSSDGGTSFTNLSAATSASHTTAASTLPDSGTRYRVVVAGAAANKTTPVAVAGLSGVTALASGSAYNCVLKTDGSAACWGWNIDGSLGDGSFVDKSSPTAVLGGAVF